MINTIFTVMEGIGTVHDFYGRVTGILKGDEDKTIQYLTEIADNIKCINLYFERLSESILYTPSLHSV